MKRILILMVALLTLLAFAGGVMAQAPAKTEKPAASAPEKAAPAPVPKPAAQKTKALKATGNVAVYEAGKMISVKVKDKEMNFDIAADAKVKGEIKKGAKVTVMYKKDGDTMVAISISGPKPKKEAPKK
jgi:Na+-transporting methylmalonyl-CoA/oxaloacetate decarboxylase gamma subunit